MNIKSIANEPLHKPAIATLGSGPASYEDLVVYIGGVRYIIGDNYALLLTCTRSAGWELWERWKNSEILLGSEFGPAPFAIEMRGVIVLGTMPTQVQTRSGLRS